MLRITLIEVSVFFLPFAVYFLWRIARAAAAAAGQEPVRPPYGVLSVIGVLLMVATMAGLAMWSDLNTDPDGRYVPPRLENGEIRPGRIEPGETPAQEETPEDEGAAEAPLRDDSREA